MDETRVALDAMSRGLLVRMSIGDWPRVTAASRMKLPKWLYPMDLSPVPLMARRNQIRASLKSNLKRHSFRIAYGWFMPFGIFPEWKRKHDLLRKSLMDLRDGAVEHRDDLAKTAAAIAEREAPAAWAEMNPGTGSPPGSFVADFKRKAESYVPSRPNMFASFGVDVSLAKHPLYIAMRRKDAWVSRPPRSVRVFFSELAEDAERLSWDFIENVIVAHAKESARSIRAMARMLEVCGGEVRGAIPGSVKMKMVSVAASDVSGFAPTSVAMKKLIDGLDSCPSGTVCSSVMIPLLEGAAAEYDRIRAARKYVSEMKIETD